MKTKHPTFRNLYDQLCKMYTASDLINSVDLQYLNNYLWHKCHIHNGDWFEMPSDPNITALIKTHLGEDLEKINQKL
jgi:hypothetical protein